MKYEVVDARDDHTLKRFKTLKEARNFYEEIVEKEVDKILRTRGGSQIGAEKKARWRFCITKEGKLI